MDGFAARLTKTGIVTRSVVMLLAGLAVVSIFAPAHIAEMIGVPAMIVGETLAGVMFFRRSRGLPPRERFAWRMFGVGLLLATAGVVAVGVATMIGLEVAAFGPVDGFFAAGYLSLVVGLAAIARMDAEGLKWTRTLLDSAIGAVAALAIVWDTALGPLLVEADITLWERVIASTYPVLDTAMIVGVVVVVLRRSTFHLDPRLMAIGLALMCQVIADLAYTHNGVGTSFAAARPVYPLFIAATAFAVAAASMVDQRPERREFADRSTPLWAVVWPYALASALVPIHVSKVESSFVGPEDRVVLYSLIAVGVIVIIRQMVAIKENRTLVERQRRELVGSVSHELRTPLTAVVGFLEVLSDDELGLTDDDRAEMMETVTAQANHMSRIVTDLIMLARGTPSAMEVKKGPVDIGALCREAARLVSLEVELEIDLDPGRQVVVDRGRITQALVNLLTNSERYGGSRTLLTVRRQLGDLVIEVHDDGPGVPSRHVVSVWNQFERGSHRLDANTPGLGVGLAIVRAVAQAHGGDTTYRTSERLGGACFVMSIPQSRVTMGDLVTAGLRRPLGVGGD